MPTERPRRDVRPTHAASAVSLFLLLLAVLTPASSARAQQARLAPPGVLSLFDVSAGSLQSLSLPGTPQDGVLVPVVLGGVPYTMSLATHDVRAPGFQLFERTATGLVLHPTPACVTYRGALLEAPDAKVAATIVDGTLEGMVHMPASGPGQLGETWVVQPVKRADPRASASLHLVFRAADTAPLPYHCGTDTTGVAPPTATASNDYTAVCEIAIEADRQFWQWNNNSVSQTQNDVTSVMNQVDFIYDRDCDTTYSITTIIVTTSIVYTTNDSSALLSQFSSFWNSNNAGIQRDIAHLFTGRNLTGSTIGVAYLGVICSQNNGYGLSQSDFTNNFNSRVGLTCHELGHNFGSPHCNSNSPCYIMCSGLGGCSGNVTLFSPSVAAQIDSVAHSVSCMPPPVTAPVVTSVSPSDVTVFAPGSVTLQGSGLLTTSSYTVGGVSATSGIVAINDNTVSLAMPQGTALGPVSVSVSNALGTSNPVTVNYTLTQPPKLRATSLVPPTGGVASYDYAGTPGNQWFLLLGLTPNTSPLQGYDVLFNPLVLSFGTFSGPLAIENFSVPVPPGLGVLQFYFQLLEGSPAGVATGVSNLTTTILQ